MFSIGDRVVYGTSGVCVVEDVCTSPFGNGDLRIYYALKPLDDSSSLIYALAEGGKLILRPLITKEEAEALLDSAKELETIKVHNEKQRRDAYRAALSSTQPKEYIRIIKTVAHRRDSALRTHRHLAIGDTEYERSAKYCLYNELSAVLGISFEEIEKRLFEHERKQQSVPK